jgi:hypothetical protein
MPPPAPVVAAPPPPPAAPPDPYARFRELVVALEREPTRVRAVAVREELRSEVGAGADETLEDISARGALRGRPGVLAALRAIEVPAFCEDANVENAVREALPFLMI